MIILRDIIADQHSDDPITDPAGLDLAKCELVTEAIRRPWPNPQRFLDASFDLGDLLRHLARQTRCIIAFFECPEVRR